ncbi:hypothetical protein CALCODRAFT_248121 [Calocera cornea HHB12733]|uniref:Uncharacterized protein n=1 Tax=Calocera cornea HHB12733 TaxID=1353952 RepID=A0A165JVK0_9BASI|nr:hypothetical protein CALCODRAFT_248121 [Calocera cornea HHB12733]
MSSHIGKAHGVSSLRVPSTAQPTASAPTAHPAGEASVHEVSDRRIAAVAAVLPSSSCTQQHTARAAPPNLLSERCPSSPPPNLRAPTAPDPGAAGRPPARPSGPAITSELAVSHMRTWAGGGPFLLGEGGGESGQGGKGCQGAPRQQVWVIYLLHCAHMLISSVGGSFKVPSMPQSDFGPEFDCEGDDRL